MTPSLKGRPRAGARLMTFRSCAVPLSHAGMTANIKAEISTNNWMVFGFISSPFVWTLHCPLPTQAHMMLKSAHLYTTGEWNEQIPQIPARHGLRLVGSRTGLQHRRSEGPCPDGFLAGDCFLRSRTHRAVSPCGSRVRVRRFGTDHREAHVHDASHSADFHCQVRRLRAHRAA